ncbi:hypothetical protein BDR06DRAFT_896810 [Suillus hirtellus]|nr:hypothetical protein BDR06DRAFT_896810 [Suillus hirtellus]
MLLGRDLLKFLWVEAISYATWLKNRVPTRVILDTTLYEHVYKVKPDLSQAWEFGTKVFVHLEDPGKLEARTEEAVFVGLDAESKAYHVYWPTRRRVSVECNVVFVPPDIMVTLDVLDEGESGTDIKGRDQKDSASASKDVNTPTAQPIQSMPDTSLNPEPRTTRARPAPGYYSHLQQGERAAVAFETLQEASALDLLDEEAHLHLALAAAQPEPTLQQALNGPDGEEWQEAVDYKISQLEKLGTWEIIDAP